MAARTTGLDTWGDAAPTAPPARRRVTWQCAQPVPRAAAAVVTALLVVGLWRWWVAPGVVLDMLRPCARLLGLSGRGCVQPPEVLRGFQFGVAFAASLLAVGVGALQARYAATRRTGPAIRLLSFALLLTMLVWLVTYGLGALAVGLRS